MALPNLSQISEALDKIMPELTPVPVGTVAYAHEVPTVGFSAMVLRSAARRMRDFSGRSARSMVLATALRRSTFLTFSIAFWRELIPPAKWLRR